MIDQELLKACILHPWSVVPRMMLIDSMIENGYSEFKALEAFEPPTVSNHLPLTYIVSFGFGGGHGNGNGHGSGRGSCYDGSGFGGGSGNGDGNGSGFIIGDGRGRRGYENSNGYRLEQQ